jgi:hypothetical protein
MATLSAYITEVRRLLHDANGNFYTDQQLTDYINSSRERVVRDTGCLRTIQIVQTPSKVPASSALNGVTPANPTAWQANTSYTTSQFIFSNIFIYQVTTAGTIGYYSHHHTHKVSKTILPITRHQLSFLMVRLD